MALPKIDEFIRDIGDLSNRPNDIEGLTAKQLKDRFDENPEKLRVFINEVIDKLNATSGMSGAEQIGSKTITGLTGTTVYAQLLSIKQELDGKAGTTDFLKKDNTDPFTPTGDYNPSTKKYVDETVAGVIMGQIPDDTITEAKMVDEMKKQAGGVYPYNDGATNRQNIQKNTTSIDRMEEVNKFFDTSGTASALTVDTQNNFEFNDRNVLRIVPNVSNTGVVNITVDSEDAVHIKKFDTDSDAYIDLEEGDIVKNTPIQLVWDNSQDFFVFAPKGGAGGVIKSIQRGFGEIENASTMNIAINSVDVDNTAVEIKMMPRSYNGASASSTNRASTHTLVGYLLDDKNLRIERFYAGSPTWLGEKQYFQWKVIEYDKNKIKSFQKGRFSNQDPSNPYRLPITPVGEKNALHYSYKFNNANTGAGAEGGYVRELVLYHTRDAIMLQHYNSQQIYFSWYLVEFK